MHMKIKNKLEELLELVTIKDVAKATGVSPSTVSRVIADHPRISEKTKQKVRKAMKEMGYYPNISARNLVSQTTKSIGVIMPSSADKSLQNPFFPEVLRGIGSVTYDQGYTVTLSTGQTDEQIYTEVMRMVYGRYVDGIILLYSRIEDPIMKFLYEKNFPFVVVGKPYDRTDAVTHVDNDNFRAGKEITQYLIKQGHQKIAFIGGAKEYLVTIDREEGYESALKEADLENRDEYKVHGDFLRSGGREAIEHLLQLKNPPTGIVVSDDLMSLGVINTLKESGYHIPKDLSIVSFNNVYLSEITRPALTTVDIHIFELGAQSVKALIERVKNENEPVKRIIIPHEIIYRNSVINRTMES